MNIFQLIKKVLDYEHGRIPGADKEARINRRHQDLTTAYGDLTDPAREAPNYADPITRFAYIYKYTTCHADIVYDRIRSSTSLKAVFEGTGWARVACIGGGPGSDFLGVLKYAIRAEKTRSLTCFLLDRETSWGDTWSDVAEQADELPFKVATHFQELDVTAPATWTTQTKYLSADIFTFIYFLSEIYRMRSEAEAFFAHLINNANSGALFLFVDNDQSKFTDYIKSFSTSFGLVREEHGSATYQTSPHEEKTDLEPYLSALKDKPKLSAKIYWSIMRKP